MIIINYLYGCPFCKNSERILKEYNIPYTKNVVTQKTKEDFKKKYKMETFPQIFYKTSKLVKIGGNDALVDLINICRLLNENNFNQNTINYVKRFMN